MLPLNQWRQAKQLSCVKAVQTFKSFMEIKNVRFISSCNHRTYRTRQLRTRSRPRFGDDRWEVIPADPSPDQHKWVKAHHRMARSMVAMLRGESPEYELVQGENARLYLEMAMMAHASHIAEARVSLPLPDGKNPFDTWT